MPAPPDPGELPHPVAPPPGWYPDPTGKPGNLYWDGRVWHTAIPVALKVGPKDGLGVASLISGTVALWLTMLLLPWSITAEIAAAIAAVLGIFGAIAAVFGGIILGAVAVVTGFAARVRVKRREANNGRVAIAGILLGCSAIILGIVLVPIWNSYFNEDIGGCPRSGVLMGECSPRAAEPVLTSP